MAFFRAVLQLWASVIRGLRRGLERVGLLDRLDQWAARSRIGLWVRSQLSVYDVTDFMRLDLPWWTLNAVTLVDEFLQARPHARVFEWGSGASTIWLEKRAAEVISVENDERWHEMMSSYVGPTTSCGTPTPRQQRSLEYRLGGGAIAVGTSSITSTPSTTLTASLTSL